MIRRSKKDQMGFCFLDGLVVMGGAVLLSDCWYLGFVCPYLREKLRDLKRNCSYSERDFCFDRFSFSNLMLSCKH